MSASTRRRLPQYILIGGLLLIVTALGLKGFRLYRIANSLQAHQANAEAMLANGPMNVDPDEAEALVLGLRSDIVDLRAEVGPFLGLASRLSFLPTVGGLLEYAPELMEMADAGTAGAAFGFRAIKPALIILQGSDSDGGSQLPALVGVLADGQADLIQAELALNRVAAARANIDSTENLPWRVQQLLEQFDEYLPLALDGLTAIHIVPELMGHNGRRTYLIMAQNEDELRPSGGFISGAGTLIVENGNILAMDFEDANVVDDFANKEYGPAPDPLLNIMGLYYLLFRDGNWYSDFPATAESSMALYTLGKDIPLDGVIAIDKRFVELLLSTTGPVLVPELEQTISAGNVVDIMRAAWGIQEGEEVSDWINSRKAFMGPLAVAIRTQIEQNPGSLDPLQFAQVMEEAITGKHLQLYFRDADTQAILEKLAWDAAIENTPGQDTIHWVEANLGYSKVNPAINRQLNYTIFLDEFGGGNARATAQLTHTIPENGNGCQHLKPYSGGRTYDELLDDCYWFYFQLFAPAGATLLQSSQHPVDGNLLASELDWPGQALSQVDPVSGLTVFANFTLILRQQVQEPFFLYALPQGISQQDAEGIWTYSLLVQKQAGITPLPVQLQIVLPDGMTPVEIPAGATIDGNLITLNKSLIRDELFVFSYQ